MKLALVLGKQQGTTVIQRLKGIKDNLSIDVFDTVPEFIDNALKRNAIYDRILVLATRLSNTTQDDLYNYWNMTSKETNVVLLCKSGVDEEKAKRFLDTFKTPVAAAMLVNTTTVQIIAEAVLRPTAELTNDYGIKDFLSVEIDEDTYVVSEEPKPEPTKGNQQPVVNNQISQNANQVTNKPEKRTLFGSLFGKKKSKENKVVQQQVQESLPVQEPVYEEQQNTEQFTEFNNTQEQLSNNYQESAYREGTFVDNTEDSFENTEVDNTQQDTDFSNEFEEESISDSSTETDSFSTEQEFIPEGPKKSNVNNSSSSFLVNEKFEGTFEEVPQGGNDFEPETYNVDEDFSNEGYSDEQPSEVHYRIGETTVTDENFGDLSLGSDEEAYRQTTEAPKVITQTVVKEVVRNVNTGTKLTTLNGVYTGRLKKIIVVTGDRGTGVTSTALNIAKTLAKKVSVLYFDCDIVNHGLLSYIDYSNFKNYENTHMNGVKLCKSSQAFNKCVISWDDDFYLLTSDYTCDTTDEELRNTSEVVAERADDFNVIVVDCPVDKLEFISDLILTGQGVICVEGTKRGFMNMLCQFERSKLSTRFKRTLVSRGNLFVTKCNKHLDLNKLVNYIKAIYEPEEVNWLAPQTTAFDGKLSDKLLNDILEG